MVGAETLYFDFRNQHFIVSVKDFAQPTFKVFLISGEYLDPVDYKIMLEYLQRESDGWVDDRDDTIRDDVRDEEGE